MAIIQKKIKNKNPKTQVRVSDKFEEREDLKKLKLYVIIVNFGHSTAVVKLLKTAHSTVQFVKVGEGTASKQMRDILSIDDNRKEIIYSLIREDFVDDFKKELEAYFTSSKKNAGIAFTLDIDSVVGVKIYKFLTQTIRG